MNNTTSLLNLSAEYNFIQRVKKTLVYSFSITTTLVIITNLLNLSILSRRPLRSSSCTYYFLASIPPVLVSTIVSPLNGILQYSFDFYMNNTQITCKVFVFLAFSTPLWYGLMLVCASIDRFFSSSLSIRLRHLNQVSVAKRIIIFVWILSSIYMSPFLVIYDYDSRYIDNRSCTLYDSTTLTTIYLMSRVILQFLLIPMMLSIFGALTIYNIRSSHRRTEGQLARMLIVQVVAYFIFFAPTSIIYILSTFISSMGTPYYLTIRNITIAWQQGAFFVSFFLYILTVLSYNQPKLNIDATWNPDGITFANSNTIGIEPYGLFITTNNTIYVPDRSNDRVQVWFHGSINLTQTVSTGFIDPFTIFVTANGNIFIDDGTTNHQVIRSSPITNKSIPVMNINGTCHGLFVDLSDTLYCSMSAYHRVVKRWLGDNSSTVTIAVGTGIASNSSNSLRNPHGIFVDINYDLYVADRLNHRIQLFHFGDSYGTTVAGLKSTNVTITLSNPTAIILDSESYLFITDCFNHRIVGSGSNGFRCIVGCTNGQGSGSDQLSLPRWFSFDSYGNIYVSDWGNSRIQKFTLLKNARITYNRPRFCANVSWDQNGINVANSSIVGSEPYAILVTTNNTIYVLDRPNNRIQIWYNNNVNSTQTISGGFSDSCMIFVTINDDIFIDNGITSGKVLKWSLITNISVPVMSVNGRCIGLFVDMNNSLYCSRHNHHSVFKKWLSDNSSAGMIVAGIGGISGTTSDRLDSPHGIFVDTNFNLYVADHNNNRIQLFSPGQSNASTAAGSTSINITITLYRPVGLALDADNYLFIADYLNNRIVGSGPNGFRCLFGCGGGGNSSNQLSYPRSLSFDSYGNIYVADTANHRIQKFLLLTNSCDTTLTSTTITTQSNAVTIPPSQTAVSYSQPKLNAYATWSANAITFATSTTIGTNPLGMFIATDNTIYVPNRSNGQIQIWLNNSVNPTQTIFGGFTNLHTIFVTANGDIFINNGMPNARVTKWSLSTNTSVPVMFVNGFCIDLFVDINNTIYCAMQNQHQVIAKSLNSNSNTTVVVAGTGCSGHSSNMLNEPWAVYVDINLDLYVADRWNHRIQLFRSGHLDAITAAGNTSINVTIALNGPVGITFDADKYLFIADTLNDRIVGSGPNGFRCIVGCSGSEGSASNQLNDPTSLHFDTYGNIFVTDYFNNRIQKFFLLNNVSVPSYNQQKLCANASWNSNAITFADNNTIGANPYGLFITTKNTIYASDVSSNRIQIWFNESINSTRTISSNLNNSYAIFVTRNGDIFIDDGGTNHRVIRWSTTTNTSIAVMYINQTCTGLFIDISNTLYCSMRNQNSIVKRWLGDNSSTTTIVAGTGTAGNTSKSLDNPYGIFVDTNFDLYVADRRNHRIQLFHLGHSNGITIAGTGSSNITITLSYPSDIILDNDSYLFIVDSGNHRIVRSGPNGFQCIVGCSGVNSSASDQLSNPMSLSFDSYGNMYVTDSSNHRIQKFLLLKNSCDEPISTTEQLTTTEQSTTISITNQLCSPPTITLIPGISTLSSPLQFRRSQDFTIFSIIHLNCNISISINTQWTIKNCSSSCLHQIPSNPTVITTFSELYIPSRTLPYGLYEIKLTVTMINMTSITSSAIVYIQITPSGTTANLIQYGTSMITHGYQQNLQLDPGSYSVDPNENTFNVSNWKYKYYCRVYGLSMFPNLGGSLLTIDDLRNDSSNPSCLSLNRTGWRFDNSLNSSLTILAGSLQSNRTYQFMIYMENSRNFSLQATGYVLVKVEVTQPYMILISCVIWTMCQPNLEFQLVNPTTQVALFSVCTGSCTTIRNITWNIYYGAINSSSNFTQWTLFNQTISYRNIWLFGMNTSNFTAKNQLFLFNPQIYLWKFEVIYTFANDVSISSLNFVINQPPSNGSCSINPLNGTTTSPFTISCLNWYDEDEIKDYTVYGWTTVPTKKMMIAFSTISIFQIYLPMGDNQTSLLHLVVHIRDQLECITEINISSLIVQSDSTTITNLINDIQISSSTNPIVQLLASGNQNLVGQILTSISQQFDQISNEDLDKAISNGVPTANIFISSLSDQRRQSIASISANQSALNEYNQGLNSRAYARDYLLTFTTKLAITTLNTIKLQASSLAQLTRTTNELTRSALPIASNRCYQLAIALNSLKTKTTYEDIHIAATNLLQCAANLMTAVNGPLQHRTTILDIDLYQATKFPDDYDTNLELDWANPNLFADGNDFSLKTIDKNRNLYYQKQLANQITNQMTQLISLVTSSLNIHLNIGQDSSIDTSQVLLSLETKSIQSFSNSFTKEIGNGQVQLPNNFISYLNTNEKIFIRSIMEPLASFGNSSLNTNLSRSISFSILDQNQVELKIETTMNNSIEIIIPRDPNLLIPSMILHNVTSIDHQHFIFNLHYLNLTTSLSISIHWEIQSLNTSLAYLFIYRFDQIPQLTSSINQIDGWIIFCPINLTNEGIYTYYIDNQRTIGHQSVIFGLRELNETELNERCANLSIIDPPITNERINFTSNYQMRIYTSGCYYLNENQQWKSDGLLVGPLTNHNQTQCYSTHLTTFAAGFVVLPKTIDWNYVVANPDFMINKTIYLTGIRVCIIYLILIIYARYYDKKDVEKLGVTILSDNHKEERYFYEILVFTGQQKNSGTKSNVHLVLLFISMFLNIMYYDLSNEEKNTTTSLSFRSLYTTPQQIIISIINEFFALIPSLLFVQLFRRWCISIAYGLCLIFIGLSILFMIARGIEFDDETTQKWFTSILLTQTLKILSLAIVFAYFCRSSNDDKGANEVIHLRQQRLQETQMWSVIQEIMLYICFLCVLFVVIYSNSFYQVDHLRKYFLNSRQIDFDYTKVSTINQYWNWLENSFARKLRAQQ
ncbi:hypothetical protein I4U23_022401 [Adineta vaga]|nr:hypothetical protein I4U23_022401 [Adineta vaga]